MTLYYDIHWYNKSFNVVEYYMIYSLSIVYCIRLFSFAYNYSLLSILLFIIIHVIKYSIYCSVGKYFILITLIYSHLSFFNCFSRVCLMLHCQTTYCYCHSKIHRKIDFNVIVILKDLEKKLYEKTLDPMTASLF